MENCCLWCKKKSLSLHKCGKCFKANFCNKECQLSSWKAGHKQECKMFVIVKKFKDSFDRQNMTEFTAHCYTMSTSLAQTSLTVQNYYFSSGVLEDILDIMRNDSFVSNAQLVGLIFNIISNLAANYHRNFQNGFRIGGN